MAEKLEATFVFEKDTNRWARRFTEETTDGGPPVIGFLYVQQWALKQLAGGHLPERLRVVVTLGE